MNRALNPEAGRRLSTRIARSNPDICWILTADWEEFVFVDSAQEEQ